MGVCFKKGLSSQQVESANLLEGAVCRHMPMVGLQSGLLVQP